MHSKATYRALPDLKRVVVNTHAINHDWLVDFFGTLSREDSMDLLRELMTNNQRQNFKVCVQVAAKYSKELGDEEFERIPTGALGLYTYYERLGQGLRQLMCGSRKFSLEYLSRDDLACLTREAADISGIPFITDVDKLQVEEILSDGCGPASPHEFYREIPVPAKG